MNSWISAIIILSSYWQVSLKQVEEKQQKQEALQAKKKKVIDKILKAHTSNTKAAPIEEQAAVHNLKPSP